MKGNSNSLVEVNHKNLRKSEKEKETFESKQELINPQENDSDFPNVTILDDVNEKETNDARVGAMFKQSRHETNQFSSLLNNIMNNRNNLGELNETSII